MKTLVTANQKGGVGKTSTLVHLAFDFFERGLRVLVVDIDVQANASYSLQNYKSSYFASSMFSDNGVDGWFNNADSEPIIALVESDSTLANIEKYPLAEAAKSFRKNISSLANHFDVCLIDTAPSLGAGLAAALYAADFVVSPIELEVYSIHGIQKMVTTIANVRSANPKLVFLGMVPSKVDGRNPRHGRHLHELLQAYPKLIIPTGVGLRSSIADALASCVPVWKIKKTAARTAAKEVRALANHIYEKMEIA